MYFRDIYTQIYIDNRPDLERVKVAPSPLAVIGEVSFLIDVEPMQARPQALTVHQKSLMVIHACEINIMRRNLCFDYFRKGGFAQH